MDYHIYYEVLICSLLWKAHVVAFELGEKIFVAMTSKQNDVLKNDLQQRINHLCRNYLVELNYQFFKIKILLKFWLYNLVVNVNVLQNNKNLRRKLIVFCHVFFFLFGSFTLLCGMFIQNLGFGKTLKYFSHFL